MTEAIAATGPKVFEAVSAVTKELATVGISKSKKGDKYKYRGIDDVYAALSPLLAEHHLVIFPARFEMLEQGRSPKSNWCQVRAVVHFQVVSGEDGSHFEAAAMGEGTDPSDKSSGKLMSYAYKNLMFQLFCIPVEGQPDPDQDQTPPPADAMAMEPVRKPAPVRQAAASEQGFEPYYGDESPLDPAVVGEIRAAATRTALSQIAARLTADEKDLYRNEFVDAWKRAPKES